MFAKISHRIGALFSTIHSYFIQRQLFYAYEYFLIFLCCVAGDKSYYSACETICEPTFVFRSLAIGNLQLNDEQFNGYKLNDPMSVSILYAVDCR